MSMALPKAVRISGSPAAPGLVRGKVVTLKTRPRRFHEHEDAGALLASALAEAIRQIQAIAARLDDADAAKILEFQTEFLSDNALLEPAYAALANGASAVAAWKEAIGAQIADFEGAQDDYFRHRVGDLRDMRDRVLAILGGEEIGALELPDQAILLADDLAPSRFLATDWGPDQAIVLRGGSPTAHVALLARARSVPMVVGVGELTVEHECDAIVDGAAGTLLLHPEERHVAEFGRGRDAYAARLHDEQASTSQPALTANGEQVQVLLNVSALAELDRLDPGVCDGIGLVRTELLFAHGPPDEQTQFDFYCRLLGWAAGRPVVIRTLDAGGDKPIAGVTIDGEANPFLGVRGIRLSLAAPDVFGTQLRALLRAATAGDLRIMLPMITTPEEVQRVRALLDGAAAELERRRLPYRRPALGIMVEVPAAALALDTFDVDFASIGSNDLLQYMMAAARDNANVAVLTDPRHPGFLTLLRMVVERAAKRGISLSLCGDLAAQPDRIPLLLDAGLRTFSMPASAVGAVKRAVATWHPAN